MTVSETEVEGGGYEQRYTVLLAQTPMRFVRRPVSTEPPEGTICFVDSGPRLGTIPKYTAGEFKGGKWHRVSFEPTHWTHWEEESSDGR